MQQYRACIMIGAPGNPLARPGEEVELSEADADALLAIGAVEVVGNQAPLPSETGGASGAETASETASPPVQETKPAPVKPAAAHAKRTKPQDS